MRARHHFNLTPSESGTNHAAPLFQGKRRVFCGSRSSLVGSTLAGIPNLRLSIEPTDQPPPPRPMVSASPPHLRRGFLHPATPSRQLSAQDDLSLGCRVPPFVFVRAIAQVHGLLLVLLLV